MLHLLTSIFNANTKDRDWKCSTVFVLPCKQLQLGGSDTLNGFHCNVGRFSQCENYNPTHLSQLLLWEISTLCGHLWKVNLPRAMTSCICWVNHHAHFGSKFADICKICMWGWLCCVGAYQGNELTRNSLGNAHPQFSQLTEPLWTDHGLKSRISVCELISTF